MSARPWRGVHGKGSGHPLRAVVQRCRSATVAVDGRTVAAIGLGLCVFAAAGQGDADADIAYIADKLTHLRIFPAAEGPVGPDEASPRMTASPLTVGARLLLVPQFTLYGDVRRGRRPDFTEAAPPEAGRARLAELAERLRAAGVDLAEGVFGADMTVHVVNWGPVTILLDSKRGF